MTAADRVSWWGNYIKTADDVPIPGAGDINGVGQEVIHPFPVHTNRGICTLPSEAGGGPLGSMLIWGHGQTGITIKTDKWQVFRFDCATKVWSAWQLGDLANESTSRANAYVRLNTANLSGRAAGQADRKCLITTR